MINKRVFGSQIPIMVKKKLEARQFVAEGGKLPEESITSQYPDDRPEKYKYNELIKSNFNMQADLSSRTPFARMWTAVTLVNELEVQVKPSDDTPGDGEGDAGAEETAKKSNSNTTENDIINKLEYVPVDVPNNPAIYVVGTNNLSNLQYLNPMESQANNNTVSAVFPPEHGVPNDNNAFLKPQAGIVSVSSETEGVLGAVKVTTINFVVHNFADFDSIYSKYFLRPGAQIFLDFGWDALTSETGLYNPEDIIKTTEPGGVLTELYGETSAGQTKDGFVTENAGDCETIIGIVTGYESKILENGSVECSLTLTSKNAALLNMAKDPTGEGSTAKFEYDLDSLIAVEQALSLAGDEDRESINSTVKDLQEKLANSTITLADETAFDEWVAGLIFDSFASESFIPSAFGTISGIFIQGGNVDNSNSYISFSLLEDRIFNRYFGHGNDATSINADTSTTTSVKIDSTLSYTSYEKELENRQKRATEPLNFLIPTHWDYTYGFNSKAIADKEGLKLERFLGDFLKNPDVGVESVKDLKKKLNDFAKAFKEVIKTGENKAYDGDDGPVSQLDRKLKRIPIRDIFVNVNLVKEAFRDKQNKSFKDILSTILDAINEESYGLWDWKVSGQDNHIQVVDANYVNVSSGEENSQKNEFDRIFKFEIMSKNSIVTNYDVSLSMPDSDIGSMYAVQAMSGTPAKTTQINRVVTSHSALQSILNNPGPGDVTANEAGEEGEVKTQGFRYLPDSGTYNLLNVDSGKINLKKKLQFFESVDSKLGATKNRGVYNKEITVKSLESVKETIIPIEDDNDGNTTAAQGGHNVADSIQKMLENTKNNVVNYKDYEKAKVLGEYVAENHHIPIPLPLTLSLTTYGISTLTPGDIFKVDYLPEVYVKKVYFQVMKVSHAVDSTGWYTTLETQFRISPHNYFDENKQDTGDKDKNAQQKRDNVEQVITNDVGVDTSTPEGQSLVEKTLNKVAPVKKEESNPPTYIHPADMVGGQDKALSVTINDDGGYLWNDSAHSFTTRYMHSDFSKQFHRRGDWQPSNDGPLFSKASYDYVKGSDSSGGIPPHIGKKIGDFDKVILNANFYSLTAYLGDKLELLDSNQYDYFDRLFSFEMYSADGLPVYVANPMYFWESGLSNYYNGYGNYANTYFRNGNNYTYVGGVYLPGEKCYLIINKTQDAERHWAVIPQVHEDGSVVDLKHYDQPTYTTATDDQEEFFDKLELDGVSPQQFG